jgi:hypothetical protein
MKYFNCYEVTKNRISQEVRYCPSKRLRMGKTLGGPLVCQTEGCCSPMLSILLTPAGQPRGHPNDR